MSAAMQNRPRNRKGPHMYNRGGYQNNNYGRRETPEPEPQNASPVRGIYGDSRTAMVMCSILGTQTTVKTRNGSKYVGRTTGFSEKGDIAMCDAKLDDENGPQDQTLPGIIIPKDVFVVCKTNGVDIKGLCSGQDFTDAGIASKINGSTDSPLRELQPWMDDDAVDENQALTLDDHTGGWEPNEMFAVNSEKFNVKSSYNEDLLEYTTKLPTPDSEGYEERAKYAQKQAEEIERSEGYQHRISKEVCDGDEESKFSSVHRGTDSHPKSHDSSGKSTYTIPALRGESEPNIRNGNPPRNQGRGLQRQNSPYSSASHGQQQQQHPMHPMNSRHMNNHYHQGPPPASSGPLNRNQGPPPQRQQQQSQQQNHTSPAHAHQYNQHPPHGGLQSNHHQPNRPPPPQQQMVPQPNHQMKSQHPMHMQGSIPQHPQHPPQHPSQQQQQMPPQLQHSVQHSSQKQSPPQHPPHQQNINLKHAPPSINGTPSSQTAGLRQHIPQPHNGDGQQNSPDVSSHAHKMTHMDMNNPTPSQAYHHRPEPQHIQPQQPQQQRISSPPPKVEAPVQPAAVPPPVVVSEQTPPQCATPVATAAGSDRRISRGSEASTSDESRNKVNQQLLDFQQNFVLGPQESQGSSSTSDVRQDVHQVQSEVVPATIPSVSEVPSSPVVAEQMSSSVDASSSESNKSADKQEDDMVRVSKLNPMAKEFKPSVPKAAAPQPAAPVEPQSPSPQPRASPHYMPQLPAQFYPMSSYVPVGIGPHQVPTLMTLPRKKATVSVGPAVVNDPLAVNQVTGQPLMATQQAILFQHPLQQGYQVINMGNPPTRMVAPNSLAMGQSGQVSNMEQAGSQNQPQPVFMTPQQMGAIPAHLPPQPAHAQPHPHPTSTQPQTVHHAQHPNPAPSPVQQHNPQSMPHPMSQGPPQSVTPQPSHYSQMTLQQHNMQSVPRTMNGQQTSVGHPTGSIAYPINISAPQYSYPNVSAAQYSYAPHPQPQTSQNSNHGHGGPQPQYVMMPQPGAQAHPPMQQAGSQPYATAQGIQFQAQHNMMQGPPQMPPNPAHNPSQGAPHLIHSGMQGVPAGMHPQVSTPPGMFMPVHQQYQHQQ